MNLKVFFALKYFKLCHVVNPYSNIWISSEFVQQLLRFRIHTQTCKIQVGFNLILHCGRKRTEEAADRFPLHLEDQPLYSFEILLPYGYVGISETDTKEPR